ncbi:MAG: beta-ketoacyl synthase N-terminal-like domain-containing protein, partial [Elusimicrobiota bacterium]
MAHHPIAIVGLGGLFPGAPTLERFWDMIAQGRDAAQEPPEGRWPFPTDEVYDSRIAAPDKVNSRRGCYIQGFKLDPAGLEIDPGFLDALDPMFHLALHAGRQALRSADLRGTDPGRIGVILGNIALPTDYSSKLAEDILGRTFEEKVLAVRGRTPPSVAPINRYVTGLPAGVLARALGLGGGSFTLDAACASSLYALKLACDELSAGRADAMLAGGLSRPDCFYTQMGFSQLRAVSPTGTCSPFDARGNGLVVGEGAGMFVLKRLEDAFRDGDNIHGVIRGIGLSNDLEGNLLAPSSEGQLRAMRRAYESAGWSPQDVDLIECHATGTPVGDAVEFRSISSLWGGAGWKAGQCVIGSVKSNVGHLLTGAGAAGLGKVLLAMKNRTLPATANFSQPAPGIDFESGPFRVLRQSEAWKGRAGRIPRRAAVSAFGFGGINAHLLVEEWVPAAARSAAARRKSPSKRDSVPVAVVGMAAHFGKWDDLRKFQERVLGGGTDHQAGKPRWRGVEDSRWFRESGLRERSFLGHYIEALDVPTDRFRIPPNELRDMLPQQLLMLTTADAALTDAGWKRDVRPDCGVFVGIGLDLNTTNFRFRWSMKDKASRWASELGLELSEKELEDWTARLRDAAGPALSAGRTTGALGGLVASRLAREFRIGGPSFSVQSEESSGFRALEAAVRALQNGEINAAIAGAVDLAGDVRSVLGAHHGRPYSASGKARPFDVEADGAVPGEGAAAVILKRLDDAVRDGDRIYCVIRGLGAASGGNADALIPDADACVAAMERAYGEAGVDPAAIGYLEAHGSGFAAEDGVEAEALSRFFAPSGASAPAVLGSVKADVGHAGAASGFASLLKAALCLYQEILPPLRNLGESRLAGTFLAPVRPRYWLRDRELGPRRAGVSFLSVDGNCAHAVLEAHEGGSARAFERLQPLGARDEALFVVEGRTVPELLGGLEAMERVAGTLPGRNIEYAARRWHRERSSDGSRLQGGRAVALVARGVGELGDLIGRAREAIEAHPERPIDAGLGLGASVFYRPEGLDGKVAFLFPGSGNQFPGMGRELSVQWPEVLRRQDAENGLLRSQYLPDLFWADGEDPDIDAKSLIFGQVTLGTMVSDLIRGFGVRPDAVIGYSLGESVGLFSLRAWSDRDEMLRRINASTLFTRDLAGSFASAREVWKLPPGEPVDWVVGVADVPADIVRRELKAGGRVYLLIVNTPRECVIGGERRSVEALARRLGGSLLELRGVTSAHCEAVRPVRKAYRDLHLFKTTPPRDVRFYRGSRGDAYDVDREAAADAILEQALTGLDYTKVVEAAYRDGARAFLEMGPGASCTRMVGRILGNRPHLASSACFLEGDPIGAVLRLLGRLVAARLPADLAALYGGRSAAAGHREPDAADPAKRIRLPIGGDPFEAPPPRPLPPPAPSPG